MMHGHGVASAAIEDRFNTGRVWLHIDEDSWEFHITVESGHDPDDLRYVIDFAEGQGLTLLDLDECDPQILDGNRIRLHLKSIVDSGE
ncbi:hypothetical protein AB0D63_20780 [Kitasatospora sp. NPDC048343]|uniref:hypothetical protein n=1 Tax=Kitasatospora sp. NPDC048343 TaxID=3154717 RepID=UPI003400D021